MPLIIEAIKGKLTDVEGWMRELVEPLYATVDEQALRVIMPKLGLLVRRRN